MKLIFYAIGILSVLFAAGLTYMDSFQMLSLSEAIDKYRWWYAIGIALLITGFLL